MPATFPLTPERLLLYLPFPLLRALLFAFVWLLSHTAQCVAAHNTMFFLQAGRSVVGLILANAAVLVFVNVLSEIIMFLAKVRLRMCTT